MIKKRKKATFFFHSLQHKQKELLKENLILRRKYGLIKKDVKEIRKTFNDSIEDIDVLFKVN